MLEKEEKRCENRWRNIEKDVARQGKYRRAKNSQGKSKKVLTFRKAVLYYTQKVKVKRGRMKEPVAWRRREIEGGVLSSGDFRFDCLLYPGCTG